MTTTVTDTATGDDTAIEIETETETEIEFENADRLVIATTTGIAATVAMETTGVITMALSMS